MKVVNLHGYKVFACSIDNNLFNFLLKNLLKMCYLKKFEKVKNTYKNKIFKNST